MYGEYWNHNSWEELTALLLAFCQDDPDLRTVYGTSVSPRSPSNSLAVLMALGTGISCVILQRAAAVAFTYIIENE